MFKNDTIFWHWIYWDGSVLRMRHWRHESFVDMGSACQCLTLLGRVNMGCAHCMPLHSPRERRQELPHRSLAASAKTGARLSSDAAVALWSCPRSPQSGRQGSARGLSPQIHPDHQVGVGKPRMKASFKGELTRISMSHRTVRKVSHEFKCLATGFIMFIWPQRRWSPDPDHHPSDRSSSLLPLDPEAFAGETHPMQHWRWI